MAPLCRFLLNLTYRCKLHWCLKIAEIYPQILGVVIFDNDLNSAFVDEGDVTVCLAAFAAGHIRVCGRNSKAVLSKLVNYLLHKFFIVCDLYVLIVFGAEGGDAHITVILTVYILPVVERTADVISEEGHKNLGRRYVGPAFTKDALKNDVSSCYVTLVIIGAGSLVIAAVVLAKSGIEVIVIVERVLTPSGLGNSRAVVVKCTLLDSGGAYVTVSNNAGSSLNAAEIRVELYGNESAVLVYLVGEEHS